MLLSITDVIQGAVIDSYLGIVTAEVVYGSNFLRDFLASIRDIVGGRDVLAATNVYLKKDNGKH
ncbi:hypothetical protein SR1949_27410 [Sphaerospermopsis reniformis]|uniref:Uncharacterized protein n=1 Tax=Sphaerospermopsis reniformis TaxID=531300 RepID=A0A479ZXX0_9CYAN|nr:hypothetical protein SR1949_27410 [Sphaerospermopsis reniformis]